MSEAQPTASEPASAGAGDAALLARETFLAGERVDMGTLAVRLGIGRATLYRRVEGREQLLDRVLGELAGEFFADGRRRVRSGGREDTLAELVRILVTTTAGLPALRDFVHREPQLALRLLVGRGGSVRVRLIADLDALIGGLYPVERDRPDGLAEMIVSVGLALVWPSLAVGDEPSGDQVAEIVRALVAGVRPQERAGA